MRSLQEYKRRSILPLAGLALAAYYLIVLLPLSRRAKELDAPLQNAWQKLSASLDQTNVIAIDFLHITNQLAETRQAIALLENGKQKAAARLELSPSVRSNMSAPFQLVVYQDQRSQQMDELATLAKQYQVAIEPAVFAGFPDHTTDIKQPALLWAALSLVQSLLGTALQCKVGVIHSLDVPLVLTNAAPANAPLPLAEIPLQVELSGSAVSLLKLLQNLPLRPDEMRAAGLPEAPPNKAPLFIEGLIMKKQSPDRPDEVRVSLRAVGFVLRE